MGEEIRYKSQRLEELETRKLLTDKNQAKITNCSDVIQFIVD